MKKLIFIITIFVFLLSLNIVFAADLSDFPKIFVKDGNLNAVVVVGNKASSSDAIAQSNLIVFFGQYLNAEIKGAAKLSNDVSDLNQNIISIGNPCVNPVTAQIMGNPQPCDKDFPTGKAHIKLYEKSGFYYLVVAGYSDKGTINAVDALTNYQDHQFDNDEYNISIQGDENKKDENKQDKETKQEAENKIENNSVVIGNLSGEIEDIDLQITNESQDEGIESNSENETLQDSKHAQENITSEKLLADTTKPNFVQRLIRWIFSWFR